MIDSDSSLIPSILNWLKGPLYAALATSAFSILFGLHSIDIALASAGAAVGWATFLAMRVTAAPAFAAFVAALAAGLYSEIVGWTRSRPATVYMIASIIPLVPGGGMYFTMLASFEGDPMKMTELGMTTIMTAAAIAAGLAIANAFGRIIFAALVHPLLQRKRKL